MKLVKITALVLGVVCVFAAMYFFIISSHHPLGNAEIAIWSEVMKAKEIEDKGVVRVVSWKRVGRSGDMGTGHRIVADDGINRYEIKATAGCYMHSGWKATVYSIKKSPR